MVFNAKTLKPASFSFHLDVELLLSYYNSSLLISQILKNVNASFLPFAAQLRVHIKSSLGVLPLYPPTTERFQGGTLPFII